MNSTPPQIPVKALPLDHALPHFAARLKGIGPVRMVALGSSSTAGEGDVPPYPHRLEVLLRTTRNNGRIDIINRGLSGEEAPKERDRIDTDVLPEQPCLVIWQIGTNCVWQSAADHPPSHQKTIGALQDGIERLKQAGSIDIILMDLQYLPAVLTPATIDAADKMVEAIAAVAQKKSVNLFRRFDLMKRWYEIGKVSFEQMVNPTDDKRLHQSEWATRMVSIALHDVIVGAVDTSRTGLALSRTPSS
jgi:GDSL-like Lipase/Acylhydrolase family